MSRLAVVEPFLGGSHRAWAEGYATHSDHDVTVFGLPPAHWKWRMQGAHVTLARRLVDDANSHGPFDALLCSDMVDVAGLLGLVRGGLGAPKVVLYVHENQLTFPLPAGEERDLSYAMTNWTSMLAADRTVFNSRFHLDEWFRALPGFLQRLPDERHTGLVNEVRERSTVAPVGVDVSRIAAAGRVVSERPRLLWNQRWQWDKGSDRFVEAMIELASRRNDFEVVLAGDRGADEPGKDELRAALGSCLVHDGHLDRTGYLELLRSCDAVVSTARHEFFGVAVVEAMAAGAMPIVPAGLSYPEIVPAEHHERCLHGGGDDLVDRLEWVLDHRAEAAAIGEQIASSMQRFGWPAVAAGYDRLLIA